MYLNKINYLFSVILIILNITILVRSWRSHDYDDYYNSYYRHHQEQRSLNPHHYNGDSCYCVEIRACDTMRQIIREQELPLSEEFKKRVQKISCGFDKNHRPQICCPSSVYDFTDPRSRRSSFGKKSYRHREQDTEEPWVWSVETDSSGDSDHNNNQNSYHPNYYYNLYQNNLKKFNNFGVPLAQSEFDGPFSNNLPNYVAPNYNDFFNKKPFKFFEFHPHFEDLKTRKNCPPSFSPEFEIPPTVTGVTAETPVAPPNAINPAMPILLPVPASATEELPEVVVTTAEPPTTTTDETRSQQRTIKQTLVNAALCGLSVNTRIVGGEDAGPGQFPWMARLAYRNKTSGRVTYRCAGSVINDRYIVTAAHCVSNLIDDLEVVMVRLGELDARTDIDCTADQSRCTQSQDFEIERITPHSMYDTPKYANDIALIKLVRSTNESTFISPLCLPVGDYTNVAQNVTGRSGIISGWGSMTMGTNTPSPMLQWVRLPIVNTTSCATSYARFSANSRTPIIVSQGQMCVQGRENMDACQGDSGGPLTTDGSTGNERYTLLGLVSFGPRTCGVSNFPGVYTRVSSYMDWIMDNLDM